MGLEWMVLGAAVAVESVLVLIVSLPLPKVLGKHISNIYKRLLQPLMAILPFAAFQLLDVYWKYEHRIQCGAEHCTSMERNRFEKSVYKSQRNGLLALAAAFLYWILYRYVFYIDQLEQLEARVKNIKKEG